MTELEGKIAIVTGATSGIGRATAIKLGAEGARVVVSGRNEQRAREVVNEIASNGGDAIYVLGDLASTDTPQKIVDATLEKYGTIDILVNDSATDDPMNISGIQDISEETYDRVMNVNAKGPFLLCQRVIPLLEAKGGGNIVNVCSIASTGAGRGPFVYTMSKHALLGLTREITFLHGKNGVHCNAVLPGGVYTPLTKTDFDNPDHPLHKAIALSPAGRPATPEELANVILFLCGNDSWFIQGAGIVADGGGTCC